MKIGKSLDVKNFNMLIEQIIFSERIFGESLKSDLYFAKM